MCDTPSFNAPPNTLSLPTTIHSLDNTTINRIAAGEVIHRPLNALKELIENSIDAHSTRIGVTISNNALTTLKIHDNGCGIQSGDLSILCHRFTTSKLCDYNDLLNINTFGFRGEALASISHIAHMTVTSMTHNSLYAYTATYNNGVMIHSDMPYPVAGRVGTIIEINDMFYNMPARRAALNNDSVEYMKCIDLIQKYSIHYINISFLLKKSDQFTPDIQTELYDDQQDVVQNTIKQIERIYSKHIADNIIHIDVTHNTFTASIYLCKIITKKLYFILFVNNRLVENQLLKQRLTVLYQQKFSVRNSHYFIYLSLTIDTKLIDINISPTKHYVELDNEVAVIDIIMNHIEQQLITLNDNTTLYTQTHLTPTQHSNNNRLIHDSDHNTVPNTIKPVSKLQEHSKIRNDSQSQNIQQMFMNSSLSSINNGVAPLRSTNLTSIKQLIQSIQSHKHILLSDILTKHIYVGYISYQYSLIQYKTNLYLVNNIIVCKQYIYQYCLKYFQNLQSYQLQQSVSIHSLVELAAQRLHITNINTNELYDIIEHNKSMLYEYFGIQFDSDNYLTHLPIIWNTYIPNLMNLPIFIYRLCCDTDWMNERQCFHDIITHITNYYTITNPLYYIHIDNHQQRYTYIHNMVQNVTYPALKQSNIFIADKSLIESNSVVQIASLQQLYKIFERC